MRNMSFSKTIPQMRSRAKTVTRRIGTWRDLRPGTLLCAVEKGQGLAKGEKVSKIGVIRVLSVREEALCWLTPHEVELEGFFYMGVGEFARLLLGGSGWCHGQPGDLDGWLTKVTRIEFEHVEEAET